MKNIFIFGCTSRQAMKQNYFLNMLNIRNVQSIPIQSLVSWVSIIREKLAWNAANNLLRFWIWFWMKSLLKLQHYSSLQTVHCFRIDSILMINIHIRKGHSNAHDKTDNAKKRGNWYNAVISNKNYFVLFIN